MAQSSRDTVVVIRWVLHALGLSLAAGILLAAWYAKSAIAEHLESIDQSERQSCELLLHAEQIHLRQLGIKQVLAEVESHVNQTVSRVPTSPQETEFLQLLANLARRVDLEVHEFRPGGITTRAQYKEMEVSIRGDGTYQSICHFLAGLDGLTRIGRVSQLSIAAPTETAGRCGMSAKICLAFALDLGKPETTKVNRL